MATGILVFDFDLFIGDRFQTNKEPTTLSSCHPFDFSCLRFLAGGICLWAVVQGDSVVLSWVIPAMSEGLVGYNVYRDGHLLNTNPIVDTAYIDTNLAGGVFYYSASSLYENGSEHFMPYEIKALVGDDRKQ